MILGILRAIAERFDNKTAAIEDEADQLEDCARHLHEQTECINRETERIRRDIENIRQETSELFNTLVVDISNAIENATTAEQREAFRYQAACLHRAFNLT